jgi:hypothetical protein
MIAAIAAACQGRRALSLIDANVVFLGRSDTWDDYSQLSVDQSARGVDLTDATTYGHNADPPIVTTAFTVDLLCLLQTPDDTVTERFAFCVRAGTLEYACGFRDTFTRWHAHGSPQSSTLINSPSLSSTPQRYLVTLTGEPNPDTTGASDALLITQRVWNTETEEYVEASVAVANLDEADQTTLTVGALNVGGQNLFSDDANPNRIRHCRISNVARSREELEALIPLITAGETLLTDGLVFDPSLDTLLDPVSGLQGTADGTTYDSDLDARLFNGTTDRLDWASPRDISGEPFTFAAWVLIDTLSASATIFDIHQDGSPGDRLDFFVDTTSRLTLSHARATLSLFKRTEAATFTSWAHVVLTMDGTATDEGVHLYVDGVEPAINFERDGSGDPSLLDGVWSLGGRVSVDNLNVEGAIAREVKAWSRVLSPQEVAAYYASLTAPDA